MYFVLALGFRPYALGKKHQASSLQHIAQKNPCFFKQGLQFFQSIYHLSLHLYRILSNREKTITEFSFRIFDREFHKNFGRLSLVLDFGRFYWIWIQKRLFVQWIRLTGAIGLDSNIGFVLCFSEILEDWILDLDFLLDIGPL